MKKIVIDETLNGKQCSVCSRTLRTGEYVVECEYCGAYTHEMCFKEHGCGSEQCRAISPHFERTDIVLTKEEVSNVIAVPEHTKNPTEYLIKELNKGEKPFSNMTIVAVFFSLITLFATIGTSFVPSTDTLATKIFYCSSFLGGHFVSYYQLFHYHYSKIKNSEVFRLPV